MIIKIKTTKSSGFQIVPKDIELDPAWLVEQVKLQIKYVVPELQNFDISLSFNDIVLAPDSKKLRDFNITQNSVLIMDATDRKKKMRRPTKTCLRVPTTKQIAKMNLSEPARRPPRSNKSLSNQIRRQTLKMTKQEPSSTF